jgi:hypothetical protein
VSLIPEIPELKDVITGELAVIGKWVVASVNARMSWPVRAQKVRYRGVELWVLPVTKDHFPGIALNCPGSMQGDDAERLIMQFLSALAWIENAGLVVEYFTGASPQLRPMERQQKFGFSIQDDFDFSYLPEPADEKAQLALAIMREGRGLNHPAYAFLSFYRVLEVALGDGKKRGKWITAHIDQIRDQRATEVIAQLRANGVQDIGEHLQKSGRHAIAHARSNPIINPDEPADARRLRAELPIMEKLAVLAIDKELGIETRHTVWEKHLYELDGFKTILGRDLAASIAKGEEVNDTRTIEFPTVSIELRKRAPYKALSNLQAVSLGRVGSLVALIVQSVDKLFWFRCHLDFANERLLFDFQTDLGCKDDGSAGCADRIADVHRFIYEYLCNGELRILNSVTNELISRKDAFIPVNCMVNGEVCDANIERWLTKARERREETERNEAAGL